MTASGPVNAPRLKSIVERIERLEEERKAASSDIKDIYSEAKGVGYDTKTLRKVIAARKIDPSDRDEQEALFETYMHALGEGVESAVRAVHSGALSIRAAAKATGVNRSAIHRAVPKEGRHAEIGTPDHDEDGVIHETTPATGVRPSFPAAAEQAPVQKGRTAGSSAASIHGPRLEGGPSRAAADCGASPEPAAVTPAVNADPPSGVYPRDSSGQGSEVGTYSTSCGVGPHDTNPAPSNFAASATAGAAVVPTGNEGRSGERDTRTWDESVGEMPAGLRRTA